MTLSTRTLKMLRDRSGSDAWALVTALQHVLDVYHRLERDETDPDVLRELSAASIETCDELEAALQVLGDSMDDGK